MGARAAIRDIDAQLSKLKEAFQQTAATELADATDKAATAAQQVQKSDKVRDMMQLRAPVGYQGPGTQLPSRQTQSVRERGTDLRSFRSRDRQLRPWWCGLALHRWLAIQESRPPPRRNPRAIAPLGAVLYPTDTRNRESAHASQPEALAQHQTGLESVATAQDSTGRLAATCRKSHARAAAQSRFTVAGEMPRTLAVSSMESPP